MQHYFYCSLFFGEHIKSHLNMLCTKSGETFVELLSTAFVISIVPLQLELYTGHREVHPQGILSTQAPSPTLRCCEGGMEGMGEMVCLVLVGLKDRGESKE